MIRVLLILVITLVLNNYSIAQNSKSEIRLNEVIKKRCTSNNQDAIIILKDGNRSFKVINPSIIKVRAKWIRSIEILNSDQKKSLIKLTVKRKKLDKIIQLHKDQMIKLK